MLGYVRGFLSNGERGINELADRIQIRDNRFFVEDSIERLLFNIHDNTRGRTADDVDSNLEQLQNTFKRSCAFRYVAKNDRNNMR